MRTPLPCHQRCAPLVLALTGACSAPQIARPEDELVASPGPVASGPTGSTAAQPEAPGSSDAAQGSLPIHGQLSASYRGRWSESESDNELFASLLLDAGADGAPLRAHLNASLRADLGSVSSPADPQGFFGLEDTYDDDVLTRLEEAYVDATGSGALAELRLGRQMDMLTPVFAWFDGARLVARPIGAVELEAGLYGGIPVYPYESSTEGDLMLGAWAQGQPWRGARARLDWMYIENEGSFGDVSDDLLGLSLNQSLGQGLRLDGAYTLLELESRDLQAAVAWTDPASDLVLRLSYYQLFEPQAHLVLELDPFTNALGALEPFGQAQLLASKGLGTHARLEAGLDLRRMSDDQDVGPSNRDFERVFLTATLLDLLPLDLELALTGDVWDAGESEVTAWGFDLTRALGARGEIAIGSLYALYEYDALLAQEQDNVRTWFLRLRLRRDSGVDLQVRYDYEDDDGEGFSSLKVGSTWRF